MSIFDAIRHRIFGERAVAARQFSEFCNYLDANLKRPYKIRRVSREYLCYQISPRGRGGGWNISSLDLCCFSNNTFGTINSQSSGSVLWRAADYDQFVSVAMQDLASMGAL